MVYYSISVRHDGVIMTPEQAYNKAVKAFKRMPKLEPTIMQDAEWSHYYALNIINGRWLEAEPVIMQEAKYACKYARDIIKGRWKEAEPIIMLNDALVGYYARHVVKGRWPEAEPIIMRISYEAFYYARDIIKGRWLEAEANMLTDAKMAYYYVLEVMLCRWFEAEECIAHSEYRNQYISLFEELDGPIVTKDDIGEFIWNRKNLQGYFAPVSLFVKPTSLLDMVIE